jgi:oligopeptide/dipeptide ABC transporter ATP-binding protein
VTLSTPSSRELLLSVRDLHAQFTTDDGVVRAVDGVSFDVHRGEVFSIVGESGSGKSVTAMTILGLLPTVEVEQGQILWKGVDLLSVSEAQRRKIRGGEIAMIFQDPLTALNPVHTVGRQIGEMARVHEGLNKQDAMTRAVEMLDLVGIPEPRERARMFPHEFSGGMRQRAMIAMAITCKPDLLIADEPTTALDVTVQAQVLEVLIDIKDEIDSAIILITHDLGVVAGLAHQVMVMYAGRQVEMGTTPEIFYESRHPYTLGLLASLPRLDDTGEEPLVPIVGSPPSLIRKPPGCAFHPRCRFAQIPGLCNTEVPEFRLVAGDAHRSACHYAETLEGVTVESLRAKVDEAELVAAEVAPTPFEVEAGETAE